MQCLKDEADVLLSQDIHFPFFFRASLNHEAKAATAIWLHHLLLSHPALFHQAKQSQSK